MYGKLYLQHQENYHKTNNKNTQMRLLYGIALILIILWLLGTVFHVAGGLIHLVLVVAVIIFLIEVLGGRRL